MLKQHYPYVFLLKELLGEAVLWRIWADFHREKDRVWKKCHSVILLTNPIEYFVFQSCAEKKVKKKKEIILLEKVKNVWENVCEKSKLKMY